MTPPTLACRACGSRQIELLGRKRGEFIPRDFEFHRCRECGLVFVEPFSGFEIYNDAYYRGHGPDPYVDYATEYRDWRKSDRGPEFDDLAGIAAERLRGEGTSGQKERGTKGPRDQWTKGQKDRGTKGLRDQRTKGPNEPGAGESPLVPSSLGPLVPLSSGPLVPSSLGPLVPLSSGPLVPSSLGPLVPSATPIPLRWLDFGCGAGGFLKYLRERGTLAGRPIELTGHDLGSYAEMLQRVDGFRILDLDQVSREPSAHYDVISMIEVVEHLPDPAAALALIARLLKPGGLLLLTTGNLASPIARRHGIHYRYCAPEIHVSLFNPGCLARLYRQLGLDPFNVRYRGAVKFKVVKSLRHRPVLRGLAHGLLLFPPAVRLIDWLYGVSAMPCAVKRS